MSCSYERIENGTHYLSRLNKCGCFEKDGDCYILKCAIQQYGKKEYFLENNEGEMSITDNANKKRHFVLEDEAVSLVSRAVALFEKEVAELREESIRTETPKFEGGMFTQPPALICFRRKNNFSYDFLVEYPEDAHLILYPDLSPADDDIDDMEFNSLFFRFKSPDGNPHKHPFLLAAAACGDKLTESHFKLVLGIEDENDVRRISRHRPVLPRLSADFNRDYYVSYDTVDFGLLRFSSYRILHVLYYSMNGKTHNVFILNPYSKQGKDAAPADAEPISFEVFLGLFDAPREDL